MWKFINFFLSNIDESNNESLRMDQMHESKETSIDHPWLATLFVIIFPSKKVSRGMRHTKIKKFKDTTSLNSFTCEVSTIQIFWAANPSGMLRTFKKLGENRVFEYIFYHFMLSLLKSSWKRSKIQGFHKTFWRSIAFPMVLQPKIFGRWIVQG